MYFVGFSCWFKSCYTTLVCLTDHCHVIHCLQDINQINTHADEMDLFTMVSRRFKKVFSKQEQMRTFPIYDALIEVSDLNIYFLFINYLLFIPPTFRSVSLDKKKKLL